MIIHSVKKKSEKALYKDFFSLPISMEESQDNIKKEKTLGPHWKNRKITEFNFSNFITSADDALTKFNDVVSQKPISNSMTL